VFIEECKNTVMHEKDPLIPTRWTLITRLKDWEDGESWRVFFDTYWKLIYAVAIKAGLGDSEAEEVVQETVITVAKKIHAFQTDPRLGSFKGWLLKITQWRIRDQFRKRRRGEARGTAEPGFKDGTSTVQRVPDPSGCALQALWDQEWESNLIDAALARVKERVSAKQYQIYHLSVIKKLPVQQVAQVLGVNAAQVYLAKHRVGSLVRREIKSLESRII
jgi:RNA polymerase sigma factor (sigma-70 family)